MTSAGPGGVRLERFSRPLLDDLVRGSLVRPAHWHPQYRAADLVAIARMLLGAYAAMGVTPDETSPWWVFGIMVEGRLVGDAGFHGPPAPDGPVEVEIGYSVVPALRGRGVASRACALLLAHAWRHGAEVVRADVEPANPHASASRQVLGVNGFRPTARGDFAVAAPVSPPT